MSTRTHNFKIEERRRRVASLLTQSRTEEEIARELNVDLLTPKDKLLALRLVKECNESQFSLFKDGPSVLNMKKLEERVEEIVSGSKQQVIQR